MGTAMYKVWSRQRADKCRQFIAIALLTLMAAGCGTSVITADNSGAQEFFRAGRADEGTVDAELIAPEIACPRVRILSGTASIRRDDGSGDANALRWQASITNTARECQRTADGTKVRVGVSGRVVEGPRGAADEVELPVRIAVREGTEVTYSRLHAVSVARTGPSQPWAFVDETIVVDQPQAAEIIVGFEG